MENMVRAKVLLERSTARCDTAAIIAALEGARESVRVAGGGGANSEGARFTAAMAPLIAKAEAEVAAIQTEHALILPSLVSAFSTGAATLGEDGAGKA